MHEDASIPCIDLHPLHAALRREIDAAIARVLDSGRFVLGEALADFERDAAACLGARHAIGVANGTDALLLALKAAGIDGGEVITSAFTFFAAAEAILHANATPVFADIDPVSLNLDPSDVERRLTPRTRAILPVHLFGSPAGIDVIQAMAQARGIAVIEDAAQAFGARLHGKAAGTFGLAGCFSFHPSKPLGALGDGGLILTNDDNLATRLRRLRNHGAIAQHRHADIGHNSRLDDIQAAVLGVKLHHLDAHLAERAHVAANYRALLADIPVDLPADVDGHAWAHYTVRIARRDEIRGMLANAGIATAVHYPLPLYRQRALASRFTGLRLAATEDACARCLSLPMFEGLAPAQQARVASVIRMSQGLP